MPAEAGPPESQRSVTGQDCDSDSEGWAGTFEQHHGYNGGVTDNLTTPVLSENLYLFFFNCFNNSSIRDEVYKL